MPRVANAARGYLFLVFSVTRKFREYRKFYPMEPLPFRHVLLLELLWWSLTGFFALLVALPILLSPVYFPFWTNNILFIVTFVTTTRYLFLLRFTWMANRIRIKVVLFFLAIPFVFFLIQEVHAFQVFLDEQGVEAIVGGLSLERQDTMMAYIRSEYLLFGVGAIVGSVVLPFRLLLSVWLLYNRKGRT